MRFDQAPADAQVVDPDRHRQGADATAFEWTCHARIFPVIHSADRSPGAGSSVSIWGGVCLTALANEEGTHPPGRPRQQHRPKRPFPGTGGPLSPTPGDVPDKRYRDRATAQVVSDHLGDHQTADKLRGKDSHDEYRAR